MMARTLQITGPPFSSDSSRSSRLMSYSMDSRSGAPKNKWFFSSSSNILHTPCAILLRLTLSMVNANDERRCSSYRNNVVANLVHSTKEDVRLCCCRILEQLNAITEQINLKPRLRCAERWLVNRWTLEEFGLQIRLKRRKKIPSGSVISERIAQPLDYRWEDDWFLLSLKKWW